MLFFYLWFWGHGSRNVNTSSEVQSKPQIPLGGNTKISTDASQLKNMDMNAQLLIYLFDQKVPQQSYVLMKNAVMIVLGG